jgi:hypothetical protein
MWLVLVKDYVVKFLNFNALLPNFQILMAWCQML